MEALVVAWRSHFESVHTVPNSQRRSLVCVRQNSLQRHDARPLHFA